MRGWLLVCLTSWLLATRAAAQVPVVSAEPAAEALHADLAAAIGAYEAQDWATARALFERVHAAAPTARTLRSLALVAFKQERFADSVSLFEASLASEVKPLSDSMRTDVHALLQEARTRAQQETTTPAPPSVPAPPKEVVAAAPPAAAGVAAPRPAPPVPPALAPRSRRPKRAGYALVGVTGAALIAGGAAWLTGFVRLDQLEDHCGGHGGCSETEVRLLEDAARLDLLGKLSTAAFVLAGAAAVSSATLLGLHYRIERAGERRMPVVGLTLRQLF